MLSRRARRPRSSPPGVSSRTDPTWRRASTMSSSAYHRSDRPQARKCPGRHHRAVRPRRRYRSPHAAHAYPTTLSLTEETYQRLLAEICACLRTHGFENIVLIGDSGGNQDGMKAVAEVLNKRWGGEKSRVHFIAEYYDYPEVERWLEGQGIKQRPEGLHDDFAITSIMMTVDPGSVRFDERARAGKAKINGVDLIPKENAIAWGNRVVEHRAEITCAAIRRSLAGAR
ncbi:MAG: creatininase family protein [Isosphaeraceae bacterium]